MVKKTKNTLVYNDVYTTKVNNISIQKGFYKNNSIVCEIYNHLNSLLSTNKDFFSRKELNFPRTWYPTLLIERSNRTYYYNANDIYELFTKEDNKTGFLLDGALTPNKVEPRYTKKDHKIYSLTYYYSRKDIQQLRDNLHYMLEHATYHIHYEIKRSTRLLKELQKIQNTINQLA